MNKKLFIVLTIAALAVAIFINKQSLFEADELASHNQPQASENAVEPDDEYIPSISYQTILENDEFKKGMQTAVKNSDLDAAKVLQQKALEIATAANLPKSQLNLLSGESGLNFMQFLAKRQLFSIAFEKRYRDLKGIQDLKLIYPEAADLFEKSDQLLALRDKQIQEIAQQLAGEEDAGPYLIQAQEQWLALSRGRIQ